MKLIGNDCIVRNSCVNAGVRCSECYAGSDMYTPHPAYVSRDLVEVVRCRDCAHRVEDSKMCAHPKAIGWDAIEPEDDDFCSYGIRK